MDLLRNLIRNKIDMSKKDKPVKVSTKGMTYAFMAITIPISAYGGKLLMKKQGVPTIIVQH